MGRVWHSPSALSLLAVTGEADPVLAMTKLAEELVQDAGLQAPPVDLRMLASFQGVRSIRTVSMTSAARLVPEGGALVIEVNERHSLGKRNFSAAHEISHTLLPSYTGGAIVDEETGQFCDDREEEFLCDVGASALLLPDRWLRQVALDLGATLSTLVHSAERFGASLQATARKLAQLNLWPCAFVLWEEGFRKADRVLERQALIPGMEAYGLPRPKFRVANAYSSQSFAHFIPWNKSIHDDSVIVACRNVDGAMSGVERLDLGHGVVELYCESIWAPYRSGDVMRGRVLSLLLPPNRRPARLWAVGDLRAESL